MNPTNQSEYATMQTKESIMGGAVSSSSYNNGLPPIPSSPTETLVTSMHQQQQQQPIAHEVKQQQTASLHSINMMSGKGTLSFFTFQILSENDFR